MRTPDTGRLVKLALSIAMVAIVGVFCMSIGSELSGEMCLASAPIGMLAFGGGMGQNPFRHPTLFDEAPPSDGTGGDPGGGNPAPPATPPASQQQATATASPPGGLTEEQITQFAGPIVDRVMQSVNTSVQSLRDDNTALRTELQQVRQPIIDAAGGLIAGSRFGVRTGEDPLTSRGYQFYRAFGLMQSAQGLSRDNCKIECEVSDKLSQYMDLHGFKRDGVRGNGVDPMLIPMGLSMLPEDFRATLGDDLGDSLAGVRGADPNEMQSVAQAAGLPPAVIRQALSMFDDTALGVFVDGAGQSGELIELLRKKEVLSRAGATTVALPPNGHLPFPKQTGAGTGYWVGESEAITGSEQATGRMELRAKKAGALVTLPNELLRFGNASVEAFVRMDLVRVLSLLADLAGLEGLGTTTQPLGIIRHSGVVTHTAATVATDGNTFGPEDPSGMIADLEEVDHDVDGEGFTFVMRSKMWDNIQNRRAGSGYAADDGKGGWLFPVNRDDIATGKGRSLRGQPVVTSSQVSNTRAKGSSSDLSYVLGGIFRHCLIGRVGVVELAMATQGDTTFAQDQTKMRAIEHCDIGLRYENAFVLCDSLDMDLPA